MGAEYIVTQMFFDNQKYFDFVARCRETGITVPIIPGIKPITAKVQATVLPTIFHIDLPEELADEVEKCKDAAAVKQVGIEWCVKQSRELMKFGVPTLHYYSMGKSDPIYRIAKELF
jgi:methylenetetrahydrofolate reductase (NADPH)